MKNSVIISCLLIFSIINSYGQWYVKKYNVTDIQSLMREQLEESLQESKKNLVFSAVIAGFGGTIFLAGRYIGFGESEDPTFLEELLGEKGMNNIAMGIGAGMVVGGAIASVAFLGRNCRIRSIINKKYPSLEGLNIAPAGVFNNHTKSFCAGVTLTYAF
jgi:hypothetical protein